MSDVVIPYWLPTTAFRFTGTRTTVHPAVPGRQPDGDTVNPTLVADAASVIRADLDTTAFELIVEDKLFNDSEASFELSEDGRLTSASVAMAGQAVTAIGSVVSLAASLAVAASGLSTPKRPRRNLRGEATEPRTQDSAAPVPLDKAYEEDFPQEAARRAAYRKVLASLVDRTAEVAEECAAADADLRVARDRLRSLRAALDSVRQELNPLDAHYLAWRARQTVTQTQELQFLLDVDDLPAEDELRTSAPGRRWHEVWERLGVMVTVAPDQEAVDLSAGGAEEYAVSHKRDRGVWYRRPRRVRATLWRRADSGIVAVRQVPLDVVDGSCRHERLPLPAGRWYGKEAVQASLGAYGTPTKVTLSNQSGASDLLAALAAAPKAFTEGLAAGAGAVDAWAGRDDAARTARAKAQAGRIEAEAALDQLRNPKAADPVAARIAHLEQQVTLARLQEQEQTAARMVRLELDLQEAKLEAERKAKNQAT